MSTLEDLSPLVEALRERIREEKRKSGLTIDRLADEAGISRTAVIKLLSNSKIDPKLTDIAALCRYFDLSLDRVFSLHSEAVPLDTPQEVVEQNHTLELENARLTAALEVRRTQVRFAHAMCFLMVSFCALLAICLVVYMIIDAQIADAGIIRGGKLSVAAWILVALIFASILAAILIVLRFFRKELAAGLNQSVQKL